VDFRKARAEKKIIRKTCTHNYHKMENEDYCGMVGQLLAQFFHEYGVNLWR